MNLHVTNDRYGIYPVQIAHRIKESDNANNNRIVNLYPTSIFQDEIIAYINISKKDFKEYINGLPKVEKVIFHSYTLTAYNFLIILLKKFPDVKVYWMFWSYEMYNLPHQVHKLYEPFATKYVGSKISILNIIKKRVKKNIIFFLSLAGIKKTYKQTLKDAFSRIHYFCSLLPSDFSFLKSQYSNLNIQYLPFAYLSLDKIMPDLKAFRTSGSKIMIGHSASPDGNHYEILRMLSNINPEYSIFLPLVYGDKEYSNLIKIEAQKRFKKLEILEDKLDSNSYYQKLSEVGWAIINVKVQQGLGNIMGLIWMGAKVFLDENASTYKDFHSWGIKIFSIQKELNKEGLSNKLTVDEVENNRRIIQEKLNEKTVSEYWIQILY